MRRKITKRSATNRPPILLMMPLKKMRFTSFETHPTANLPPTRDDFKENKVFPQKNSSILLKQPKFRTF